MGISIWIKSLVSPPLANSGVVSAILWGHSKTDFVILTYHRILDRKGSLEYVQDGMFVDPGTFESHVRFLLKRFRIIPLEELHRTETPNGVRRPACVLTFDDGWADFYVHAYPILKKYGVPATVFLPTDFIGTSRLMWPDKISMLIQARNILAGKEHYHRKSSLSVVDQLENIRGTTRRRSETAIGLLKNLPLDEIEKLISELSVRWECELPASERVFLTWGEILEMVSSGFVQFGSHTAGHNILTMLNEDEVRRELTVSRDTLISKGVVQPGFIPFCYPNGAWNVDIERMVADAGYQVAVSTEKGWNAYGDNMIFRLKRISIHQDVCSTPSMLACRIAGIY